MVQIHKKFTDSQVKDLVERHLDKKIERKYIQKILGIKKTRFFALVKGKIERPYRWIQDRLVRTCYRENIRDIKEVQLILNNLVQKYNYRIVHSTTGEIPYIRFQRAIREKRTLFREFTISPPFKSTKDIFCLRVDRMVNSYRKI